MKKFFKKITKKSPSKEQGAAGSPNLGGGEGAQASEASNLSYMYDVREKDLGRLHKAAWTGDINKVRQLAKKDHSPLDKENRTPLHLACARGHAAVVQELLEWKAKTNLGDNDANTPLMKAVQCQHADCVELLLEHHASVEVMDTEGNTCLHRAVQDGNYQIAEMLIKARASPDAKNKHGESILHAAVKTKQEEICRLLLRSGADVNIVDKEFRLPLMYACQDGSINLVKLLLEYQADTTSKDDKGWTADDYAVIKGHHACSTLIADHDRRYNLGSAASTPRTASFPPSSQVTPRERTGSVVLGIPAEDVAGEDSGEESASRISGHGGGAGDSWGDDTDISLAADDKGKARTKINLSKLVRNMSESEKEESVRSSHSPLPDQDGKQSRPSLDQQNSIVSQPSIEDSWAAADSPITPRRVSFKKDAELSEIRDISMQEEPEEVKQTPSGKTGGYTPTAIATSTPKVQLTAEKQREIQGEKNAFLEDFGLGDVDDISELSEHSAADPNKLKSSAAESDWDSTIASDQQITPRPGILKKWKQDSEWDSEVEDDAMPGNITTQEKDKESTFGAVTPRPVTEQQESDWDSTVEAVTPRQNAGLSFQQIGVDDIEEEKIEEEVKPPPLPRDYPSPTHPMEEVDGVTAVSAVKVQEDDEISGWDSDDGDLPSEPISPPSNFADRLQSSPLASPLKQSPHQSPKKDSPLGSPRKESPRGLSPLSTPRKSPKGPSPKASPKRKPSPKTSPRKSPRRQRDPSDSDEDSETVSEWELERKKKKSLPPPPVASKFIDDFYDDDSDVPIKLSTRLSFEERERQKQWEEDGKAADALLKREAEEAIEAERKELEAQLSEDDQPEIDIKTTTVSNKPVEFQEPTISLDDSDDPGEEIKKESNNNITRGRTTADTKPNEQTTPLTQPLQPVISMKEPQFSTHRELQQRLQIRGVQNSLPTTQAMQFGSSDPFEVDEDSYASDNPELPLDKPDTSSTYYPGLLSAGHFYNLERTPDDDVLSYTSTEFDNDSVAQPVIGKDLLMNLNISDPTTILKIQDHVRQTQKSFEQERNQRLILDNKHRLLSKEKHDLQKKIDVITSQKSTLEQNKLNLEAKIRSLEYGLTEEVEKRKNAETLLIKTKDQLVRKEEQYTKEIEAKQQAELNLRNLQLELRAAHNNVKELKDEVRELQHQAQHEKNARQLQEQINDEQQKLQLHQQREVIQSSSHHPVQRSNSGEIDEGAADNEKLRAELYALQMELERQRTRLKDENALLSSENDDYHQKIEELKNTIKLDEEAMVHLNMQHNIALSNIKTECNHISSNLDKERAAKEKAEAELGSISTRLTSTISEMERANQARNELEQSLQHEKEMWSQKLDKKDSELNELKQTNNQISQRIRSLEEKHHQMESELNVSNTSLMERTNQLQQYRFDVEKNKSSNGDSDFNFRLEKEQNSKLQMKIETLQEK
ncbi:hypothetical protein SNE40_015640 [Patella caerulea]|uniref:CCDC144C-like coiled-coil domain-containing protein n=1 Tax=Patella caerulea TaxID=87958 RepID=A0AAN8JP99_PATCE